MMFIRSCLIATSLLLSNVSADVENGKRLYEEAKCARCHTPDIYTDEDRAVKNYEKLVDRIEFCAIYQESGWNDKEIVDVIDFLNTYYYKYPVEE